MKRFFAGLLLGILGGVFALQNHVVRTNDGVIVIARTSRPPIMTSYLDVRDWSATMWEQYPDVAAAVVKAGRTDLLTQNALGSFLNGDSASGKGIPATSTSSLMDAPLKFLQGTISGSTSIESSSGTSEVSVPSAIGGVPAPGTGHGQTTATYSGLPVVSIPDTVLGIPGNFPAQFLNPGAASLVPSQEGMTNSAGTPETATTTTTAKPAPETPAATGSTIPQAVPSPIQDRAAGQDPEWVRGLLRSLIPTEGVTSPASQGTTTGLTAPAPEAVLPPTAVASDWLRTVTLEQQQINPAVPVRAVRPF